MLFNAVSDLVCRILLTQLHSQSFKAFLFLLFLYSYHVIVVLVELVEVSVFVGATFPMKVGFARATEISEFTLHLSLRSFELHPTFSMYVW